MPAKKKPATAWKEYPEPPFPNEKARDAYRRAREMIRKAAASPSPTTALDLSEMGLTTLPPEIGQLTGLTELRLDGNQLTELAPEIGQLTTLTRLDLDNNQLAKLPPEIGLLRALRGLTIYNNRLNTLPSELRNLTMLRGLYLHWNDALGLPPEVLGKSWNKTGRNHEGAADPAGILDYYFSLQEAKTRGVARSLNEAKVLFLGQPKAGKSSLIHALTKGWPTPDFPQTDGIVRREWKVPVEDGRVVTAGKGETLQLNLWDFGGQEIYKATHTYFLTKRAVYVIVTTARENADADLEEWLETAKSFGGGAPVWVVVNQHDENPTGGPDEVELMRKYYPMLRGFIRTQCQHAKKGPEKGKGAGRGIYELRDKLAAEAWAMPEVRQLMAPEALAIKERLESMMEPTLTLTDYRALCAELGETGTGQQETLLGLWDKLGTVRYFPDSMEDEPEFHDTAILNPEWVTEAVYRVLEDPKLKERHGLVTDGDLARITGHLKHKAGSHHLIRKVMRRFSQLYDTGDGRMFVPHLLEDREPRMDWPEGALKFVYQYTVLPAGLVPAFIARMHQFHDKSIAPWRKGVVLAVQSCRVKVTGDRKAKTLTVEVAGKDADRRRDALDQVRYALEEMHASFAGGQAVEELIPVPGFPNAPMVSYRLLRTLERKSKTKHEVPVNARHSDVAEIDIAEVLGGVRTPVRAIQEQARDAVMEELHSMIAPGSQPHQESPAPRPVLPVKAMMPKKAALVGFIATVLVAAWIWLPWYVGLLLTVWALVTAMVIYHDSRTFFRRLLKGTALGWAASNALGITMKIVPWGVEVDRSVSISFNVAALGVIVALIWAARGEARMYPEQS